MDNTILENFKLDDIVLIPSAADDLELTEHDNGDITISGWFITERLMENRFPKLKILASAFSVKGAMSEFNGRVLSFHDRMHEPIGKVLDMVVIPGKGVQGTVRIFAENPDLLKRSIREKVLDAFSIGFEIKKYEYDEDKEEMTVTSLVLKELSLVNLGADKNAKFKLILQELAEIYNITELVNTNPNIQPKRSVKLDKNKDQKVDENVKLDEFMVKHEALGVEVADLKNILTAIKESQADLDDRVITKGEFQTKIEKIATDLDAIAVQVTEAKAAAEDKSSVKLQYKDYRSLITDFIWLTDDEGNKLGKIAQRAHCLFQLPIDYDKMDRGQELQNLRNLHDATLIADAMNRYKSRDRYNIQSLKLFKQLVKATEVFDKDVALAMAGGNTGFGAEWLPSELSSEFNEILRLQPSLVNRFQMWNMPKGGSAKFPFQNGKAVVYKGDEPLVDNAAEARKTNIATGVKLFTPSLFIGALIASEEVTEDAILDMVAFIRTELSKALLEGLESALINGDNTAVHFDNADVVKYQSYNVETTFKGIRKLAVGNTRDIEVASSTSGVGALELVNFINAKQDMEIAGIVPQDCVWVTGIKGKSAIQNALFKTDALGVLAFMISGTLPTIDGTEIHISGQYDEALASSGLSAPNTDVKHTSITSAHKPSFRIGQRRGVTLEFNKNILTQQQQFVATARWDFGIICADSIKPVAGMINIQHTA